MADPHITAAGALTGMVAIPAGLLLGAHIDALIIGLVAAVAASAWLETIDSRLKSSAAVLLSSLLAAYGSPFAAGLLANAEPAAAQSAEALRMLMAVVIGGGAPRLIPLSFKWLERKLKP